MLFRICILVTQSSHCIAILCFLQVSSQHPYAEQYIGRPHVMTVDYNNSLEFDSAIREIMRTKVLMNTVHYNSQG